MKKVWFSAPLYLFWIVWKARNSRAFENEEHSIHGCKSFFLCNLWAWTKGFFGSSPLSVVDFVDWLGPGLGFFSLSFVYLLYTLGCFLEVPLFF